MFKRIIFAAALIAVLAAVLCSAGCASEPCDYSDKLDSIASVELINVTDIAYYADELVWEPVRSLERDEWQEALADAAGLEYVHMFPSRTDWREGCALKVVFDEPVDGCEYVLYMEFSLVRAKADGERIKLFPNYYTCVSDQWSEFIAKYIGE